MRSTLSAADIPALVPEYIAEAELANLSGNHVLGSVLFDAPKAAAPGVVVHVPMRQLGAERLAEVWMARETSEPGHAGAIRYRGNDEVLFGAVVAPRSRKVELVGFEAYEAILRFTRSAGYPYLLRMWNHFPRINQEIAGLERYRAFCVGRHRAFSDFGFSFETDLPAASAVGSAAEGLIVYFIASSTPATYLENRRQMSAFHYPPQYGPKSPSFSRGAVKEWSGEWQLYVSGTASIVNHETRHAGSVLKQLDETVHNMEVVLATATGEKFEHYRMLPEAPMFKVYIRNASEYEAVRERFEAAVGNGRFLYLEADICRKDLLLEIEAIVRIRE